MARQRRRPDYAGRWPAARCVEPFRCEEGASPSLTPDTTKPASYGRLVAQFELLLARLSCAYALVNAHGGAYVTTDRDSDSAVMRPFRSWLSAVAVGVALVAYCLQPMLRFFDPTELAMGALLTGVGISGGSTLFHDAWTIKDFVLLIGGVAMLIWGLLTLTAAWDQATINARLNQARCDLLQRDMLSSKPKRGDSAALFSALACQPRGAGTVHYVPRSRPIAGGRAAS
jgi:sulfite exporter TauE/SafE